MLDGSQTPPRVAVPVVAPGAPARPLADEARQAALIPEFLPIVVGPAAVDLIAAGLAVARRLEFVGPVQNN